MKDVSKKLSSNGYGSRKLESKKFQFFLILFIMWTNFKWICYLIWHMEILSYLTITSNLDTQPFITLGHTMGNSKKTRSTTSLLWKGFDSAFVCQCKDWSEYFYMSDFICCQFNDDCHFILSWSTVGCIPVEFYQNLMDTCFYFFYTVFDGNM